jgi:hypothetical protein
MMTRKLTVRRVILQNSGLGLVGILDVGVHYNDALEMISADPGGHNSCNTFNIMSFCAQFSA